MSLVGLYCEKSALLQAIETAFNIARLKNTQGGTCETYPLQNLSMLTEAWIMQQDQMHFLILSCKTINKTFAIAETLWKKNPALSIICVVQTPEEVFAALPYPFFHVVREFCLEQDLGAVLCKIERAGSLLPRWCSFQGKNELMRIRLKEILYLESDRHEIKIYTHNYKEETNYLTIETLTQCEEKLQGFGFARIHKSYLVNLYHVAKLEKDCLTLDCGKLLYISRYRYAEVKLQFESYLRHLDFL